MIDYKLEIKSFFNKIKQVKSPALAEIVYFNAKGMNHLLYKKNRNSRSKDRIKTNFILLPRAIQLLEKSTFWQEESYYVRDGDRYFFWAFEAVIDGRRIKVIVRQVNSGKKHFWSVIPAWRKNRNGILNAKSMDLEK